METTLDFVRRFLDEKVVFTQLADDKISIKEMRDDFLDWCEQNNIVVPSTIDDRGTVFRSNLEDLGYQAYIVKARRMCLSGAKWKDEEPPPQVEHKATLGERLNSLTDRVEKLESVIAYLKQRGDRHETRLTDLGSDLSKHQNSPNGHPVAVLPSLLTFGKGSVRSEG